MRRKAIQFERLESRLVLAATPLVGVVPWRDGSELGPDPAIFEFQRNGDLSKPLDVYYELGSNHPLEATPGDDYQVLDDVIPGAGQRAVRFTAGSNRAYASFLPLNDHLIENFGERITVSLVDRPQYDVSNQLSVAFVNVNDANHPSGRGIIDPIDPWVREDIVYFDAHIETIGFRRDLVITTSFKEKPPLSFTVPAIQIYLDTDQEPLTGDLRPGHVRGAEYRIDASMSITEAHWRLTRLPTTADEVSEFRKGNCQFGIICQPQPSELERLETNARESAQINGDTITIRMPMSLIGQPASVNVFAIANTPGQLLGNAKGNGDRSPNFGALDAATGRVVVPHPAPTTFINAPDAEPFGAGSIDNVRFVTLADQFRIELQASRAIDLAGLMGHAKSDPIGTFQGLYDTTVSSTGSTFHGEIILDTDQNIMTGNWPMGGAIPTWGGDVRITFDLNPSAAQDLVKLQFKKTLLTSTIPISFGGSRNDGHWMILGENTLILQASLGTFSTNTFHSIVGADEFDTAVIPTTGKMTAMVSGAIGALADDHVPNFPFAIDTRTGQYYQALRDRLDPDDTVSAPDADRESLLQPSAIDITRVEATVVDDQLVVQGFLNRWLVTDSGNLFEVLIDSDRDVETGELVTNALNGGSQIGADYQITITHDFLGDVVAGLFHESGLVTSHQSIVQPGFSFNALQEGHFTLTLPLSVLGNPSDLELFVTSGFAHGAVESRRQDIAPFTPLVIETGIQTPNEAPLARDDDEVTETGQSVTVAVLDNDEDPDGGLDPSSLELLSLPSHGGIRIDRNRGTIIYTPTAGFSGFDEFEYAVRDNHGTASNPAAVTIEVAEANDPPVALNDRYIIEGDLLEVTVADGLLSNDSDPDLDEITARLVQPPEFGSVEVDDDGSFRYLASSQFTGSDQFTYVASDGREDSAPATVRVLTSDAVTLTVTSSADSGTGSLREAIQTANEHPGRDRIEFDLPNNGLSIIRPQSPLPAIVDPVVIDGLSQPGFGHVIINGSQAGEGVSGITLATTDSLVRGLLISDFDVHGIMIQGGGNHVIQGNGLFGTTSDEKSFAGFSGIHISNSESNLIGTDGDGVDDGSERNKIEKQVVGVAVFGRMATRNHIAGNDLVRNVAGVFLNDSRANQVGANGDGIADDVEGNRLEENFLGVAIGGQVASGNRIAGNRIADSRLIGILIAGGATGNQVGTGGDGSSMSEGNVIVGSGTLRNTNSKFLTAGVFLSGVGTRENVIAGNFIGTNTVNDGGLGNLGPGILIKAGASNNLVGTDGDGVSDGLERNIISGNDGPGIEISGEESRANRIAGNYIGTNSAGDQDLGNVKSGILISDAPGNIVGTNGDGQGDDLEGNLVSGNDFQGIEVGGAASAGTLIAGNLIGTNAQGDTAVANGESGIWLHEGASNTRIGSNGDGRSDSLEGNVISGNTFNGVVLFNFETSDNVISGNLIGTDTTGSLRLGNRQPSAGQSAKRDLDIGGGPVDAGRYRQRWPF